MAKAKAANSLTVQKEVERHKAALAVWHQDIMNDYGSELEAGSDEIWFDLITSYIASEISGGENSVVAKELRRQILGEG